MILLLIVIVELGQTKKLSIRNLHDDPLLLVKERQCKIQTGTIKIIHPINLTAIEDTAETLISSSYKNNGHNTNPLINILRQKTKKLYSNIQQLKPRDHQRRRRWNTLGTIWKWLAGTPDASDLQAINTTMNDLIDQNNHQYTINQNINNRIQQISHAIKEITIQTNLNDLMMNDVQTITSILHIDTLNQLLEDIQDAIMLSKLSITTNKILSIREILMVKGLLQDQGINIHLPDEALQFVTPKFATSGGTLLYFMHVPLLESSTSSIIRIYPIINNNYTIDQYPEHIVKNGNQIFTTESPNDFVQKSSYLKDLNDKCINPMVNGKKPHCNVIFNNQTTYKLISDNTILASNVRNQILNSNCGPDNRTIEGNVLISFANCTIKIDHQIFKNEERTSEPEIIQSAFYNLEPNWTIREEYNLEKIQQDTFRNRKHLEHVYLEQSSLNFKFWSLFGGFSFTGIAAGFIIISILIRYGRRGTGRSSLEGGVVTGSTPPIQDLANLIDQVKDIQQQQQQLLATLDHQSS